MANNKSKRRVKWLVLVVVLLVVAGLTTAAILKRREPFINVQTEKVGRTNLTELVVANGRIQPVLTVKISPEVSGEIIKLPVKEGQRVKKGDLLVQIKPDMYEASRNSSEASYQSSLAGLSTAQSSLIKAESEFRRYESLFKSLLVSESVFLEAKTSFDIAKAQLQSSTQQVEMAKAALQRATEDLSKTTILAPLEGTVTRLNSQLGERVVGTAMMAGTEIMSIADLNMMEARVDIGEIDVVLIATGQVARLEVDAFKDKKFGGRVYEIANSSKLSSQGGSQEATKFEVKILITEKEVFRPGMTVTAEIETRYRTNVLAVPIASVTTRMPKPPETKGTNQTAGGTNKVAASTNAATATNATATTNVATVATNAPSTGKKGPEGPKPIEVVFLKDGDKAKMVPVKRGISDDTSMEILEGLKEGDEVVSGGYKAISKELEDGKKVKIGTGKTDAGKDRKP
jgi:HlyD family secretion protein